MVGASVDAFDDGVGGALQFIMQAALDQPAEHRFGRALRHAGRSRLRPARVRRRSWPGAWS